MKLLACDKCHAVVQLVQKRIKSCKCGNIRGKYTDKRNIKVIVKDKKSSRILGLDNWVRYGFKKESKVWIIPFDNETVTLKEQL
jgi:hypothetical protein